VWLFAVLCVLTREIPADSGVEKVRSRANIGASSAFNARVGDGLGDD